jgi:non-homologous end joining protein Ku
MWPRLESARLSGVVQEMHRNELRMGPPNPHIEEDQAQEAEAEVVDLLAALRASVEAAKARRSAWDKKSNGSDDPDDQR